MVLIYKDYFYQTVASEPDHHLILKILGKSCRDSFNIFIKQTLLFFMFILKNQSFLSFILFLEGIFEYWVVGLVYIHMHILTSIVINNCLLYCGFHFTISLITVNNFINTGKRFCQYWFRISSITVANTDELIIFKGLAKFEVEIKDSKRSRMKKKWFCLTSVPLKTIAQYYRN